MLQSAAFNWADDGGVQISEKFIKMHFKTTSNILNFIDSLDVYTVSECFFFKHSGTFTAYFLYYKLKQEVLESQ